jgi:leucyl/phenylalanyl-tRNA---protein transferase
LAKPLEIHWLSGASDEPFPPIDWALEQPNGLLCAGGDLSVERLRLAYQSGIFPWFSKGEPIMWWSPSPRFVMELDAFYLSKRDWRSLKQSNFSIRSDTCFIDVMRACAAPRLNYPGDGTWISEAMLDAYSRLHEAGDAHSIEVFVDDDLVGGIYGVASGGVFCGESMFGLRSNASKAALAALVLQLKRCGFALLDCQIYSDHLADRGAVDIARSSFLKLLQCESKHPRTWLQLSSPFAW